MTTSDEILSDVNTISDEIFNDVCKMKGKKKSMPIHLLMTTLYCDLVMINNTKLIRKILYHFKESLFFD